MNNPLTPEAVYATLKRFFPEKNDDFACNYADELGELTEFGINTEAQLVDLLQRRADQVIEIDQSPMDVYHERSYAEELGAKFVAKRLREGFWFAYPALLRIALELEFGEAYQSYAQKRDGIA